MSFSLLLQINSSPINKIGKSVSTITTLTGNLRNESDVLNPQILVETTEPNIQKANYCTIPNFGRKYFIEEMQSVRTNIWLIKAHVDVLDSFKDKILANSAVILRQENNFNLLLNDGVFKCQQDPRFFYRAFPAGLGQFNYILLAQGGDD